MIFRISSLRRRKSERGSALVYILIAIALLAALTITFMEPSSQQTTSQGSFKTVAELENQASLIRAAIQECVLSYPKGDKDITDADARTNYPIDPNSTYYNGATPGQSGDHLVRNMRCPGNNPGGADQQDHALIFSGESGKFMPPAPDLFDDWEIYNGIGGVFFWTKTNKSDSFLLSAMNKLDEKFSECEADVIDAVAGAQKMESGGAYSCPQGYVCFRVTMIKGSGIIYNGDTDGDEDAAGCAP